MIRRDKEQRLCTCADEMARRRERDTKRVEKEEREIEDVRKRNGQRQHKQDTITEGKKKKAQAVAARLLMCTGRAI